MADNFVTKEPALTVTVSGEVAEEQYVLFLVLKQSLTNLTFRHRASCILGQAFRYSPENAFYIFNQQIYFII